MVDRKKTNFQSPCWVRSIIHLSIVILNEHHIFVDNTQPNQLANTGEGCFPLCDNQRFINIFPGYTKFSDTQMGIVLSSDLTKKTLSYPQLLYHINYIQLYPYGFVLEELTKLC